MRRLFHVAVAVLVVLAGTGRVEAVRPSKSLYTALDLSHCTAAARPAPADSPAEGPSEADGPDEGENGWLKCEGLPGYPVFVAEDDLRFFVSVGTDGEARRAASQTLGAFNTLFKGKSTRTALEWRFVIRDEKPVPYAMIVRYFTKSDARRGEVLVVTRVTDTETCHVAYIDAVANPNAIVLARRMADERARKFDCKGEPAKIGATGKSPM